MFHKDKAQLYWVAGRENCTYAVFGVCVYSGGEVSPWVQRQTEQEGSLWQHPSNTRLSVWQPGDGLHTVGGKRWSSHIHIQKFTICQNCVCVCGCRVMRWWTWRTSRGTQPSMRRCGGDTSRWWSCCWGAEPLPALETRGRGRRWTAPTNLAARYPHTHRHRHTQWEQCNQRCEL